MEHAKNMTTLIDWTEAFNNQQAEKINLSGEDLANLRDSHQKNVDFWEYLKSNDGKWKPVHLNLIIEKDILELKENLLSIYRTDTFKTQWIGNKTKASFVNDMNAALSSYYHDDKYPNVFDFVTYGSFNETWSEAPKRHGKSDSLKAGRNDELQIVTNAKMNMNLEAIKEKNNRLKRENSTMKASIISLQKKEQELENMKKEQELENMSDSLKAGRNDELQIVTNANSKMNMNLEAIKEKNNENGALRNFHIIELAVSNFGLSNPSNMCYRNATLQCLLSVSLFVEKLKQVEPIH